MLIKHVKERESTQIVPRHALSPASLLVSKSSICSYSTERWGASPGEQTNAIVTGAGRNKCKTGATDSINTIII